MKKKSKVEAEPTAIQKHKNLPQELINRIFLRLPVCSIVRFMAVSKTWMHEITSPHFISEHHAHQREDVLVRYCHEILPNENFAIMCERENMDWHVGPFHFPYSVKDFFFDHVYSCNGIILLADLCAINCCYFWNPSLRQTTKLPPLRIEKFCRYTFGFGYDSSMKELKVLRISCSMIYDGPTVELYRCSTNIWQDISDTIPDLHLFSEFSKRQLYWKEACHWIASRKISGTNVRVIYVIHMNGQNFLQLSLPTFLTNEAKGYESINLYTAGANALHVVSGCFRLYKEYKVWVMRIYGDPLSWELKYSINDQQIPGISLNFDKPLGMRKDGQILWTTKEGYLISYDHEDPAENSELIGPMNSPGSGYANASCVTTFKESLYLFQRSSQHCVGEIVEGSSVDAEYSFQSSKEVPNWGRKKPSKKEQKRKKLFLIGFLMPIGGLLYMLRKKGTRREKA